MPSFSKQRNAIKRAANKEINKARNTNYQVELYYFLSQIFAI